jgi:hypothetical protein
MGRVYRARVNQWRDPAAMAPRRGELFYLTLDNRLMAVPVKSSGGAIDLGLPTPLFATQIVSLYGVNGMQYAVSADGQRFLVSSAAGDVGNNTSPIAIVLNWKAK